MQRKRHQYTSFIEGYKVHVTYDARTRRNARISVQGLGSTFYGDTWIEAIHQAGTALKKRNEAEAVEGSSK